MGGCVASLMVKRNEMGIVSFQEYRDYKLLGDQAVPVPGTEKANASAIYRMSGTTDEEYKKIVHDYYYTDPSTLRLSKMCKEGGDKTAMTYRVLRSIERKALNDGASDGKTVDIYVFEPQRRNISYAQLWNSIESLAKGFVEIGLKEGQTVAIYEETRWEWFCTLHSIWSCRMIATTVYANLGDEALIYALQETGCAAIVCNGKSVPKLINMMKQSNAIGAMLLYIDKLPEGVDTEGFVLYSWDEVLQKGKTNNAVTLDLPTKENSDDTALIMYTSGTTGNPKGVKHTHGSLGSGFHALNQRVNDILGEKKESETYCSYLPLAHVMELAVLSLLLFRGCLIGFGNPRTLTNKFAKPHGDFVEYRPVIVVAVPRIFDTIKKAVEAMLPPPGSLKRTVFDRAYAVRRKALEEGNDTPYFNAKVFALMREAMGGRVRTLLSGGGPLSPATQEFVNVVFGIIVQGWGLTETVCCGAIQRKGNLAWDNVGQLVQTVEFRLLDTDEYKHTDKPNPRGEILLRGPFLFKGYHKQDAQTREVIDAEGWFHTGDVGSLSDGNTLRIVGRVKGLAKNSNGEYVALEFLEAMYGQNKLCTPNGVCVLVHPNRSYIALLALTTEEFALRFAKENKIAGTYPEILNDKLFQNKVVASFQATARSAGRKSFEVVRKVRLLADEWTPENDVLTAAMKLKRRVIDERYKDLISELFAEDE